MKKQLFYMFIIFIFAIGIEASITETIIVGTNAEFAPLTFKEGDIITGFDIDLITEIFKKLNKKFIIQDIPFSELIPSLQRGDIHIVIGGMIPTKEREQYVLFTKPHLTGDCLAIISLKTNMVNSIADLINKIVAVNEGYFADYYISAYQDINLLRLSSNSVNDGIITLQNKIADAFITTLLPMQPYFTEFGKDNFNIAIIEDLKLSSAFAISK